MKKRLLAGMIAVMSVGAISASFSNKEDEVHGGENDSRIIVKVNQGLENLTEDEIFASQDKVFKSIKRTVSSNVKLVTRYSVLNNAFVCEINKNDIEAVKNVKGVESVTLDEMHDKKSIASDDRYQVRFVKPDPVTGEDEGDMIENVSAVTMNKPSGTNEGEGTVIAILDNEFYLRGEHDADPDPSMNDNGEAWNHAAFKALPLGTAEKLTYENEKYVSLVTNTKSGMHAQRKEGASKGEEGSLYFNTKVPFYFDYGGETSNYNKVGPHDFDVSSNLSYHGSHVASIASANADTYKGIAPKAQLACMKVFTTYIKDSAGGQMGFETSTGAYDSAILEALEDAIKLGVDGINMSLGSDLDDFDGSSITMQTLADLQNSNNILSAISAGNAGKSSYSFTGGYGNWTTDMVETGILGSYANSTDNMIIASSQPTQIYYEHAFELYDKNGDPIKNVAYEDQIVNTEGLDDSYNENDQRWMVDIIKNGIGPDGKPTYDYEKEIEWVYIPGFGAQTDYDSDIDYEGKVVVVNRGSTSFAEKYSIAAGKGAAGLVIINNDPTETSFNFRCSFGDDFQSLIPCCLALYRDKPTFESNGSGKFKFISKKVSDNDLANTISSYSSDGARFDYSLKPDISTPGENIRGAVPPQKREHRNESPYSTYEYLSGTSMAAPNYAGVQSLMLSKVSKDVYADGQATSQELTDIKNYAKTVDLRLMSTATPMFDPTKNPEDGETKNYYSYSSPRVQGAGQVNISKAYETEVYLDGVNPDGSHVGKSKIQLFNNEDIAKGNIKLSFFATNESGSPKTYTAKVTVMRPAIATNNEVVSKKYVDKGEVDSVEKIPGFTYVTDDYNGATRVNTTVLTTNSADGYSKNDVIKVTKQIEYYDTLQTVTGEDRVENYDKTQIKKMEPGYYYNASETGCEWLPLPSYDYQSVQDVILEEETFTEQITIPAGTNKIELTGHQISEDNRRDMLAKFPFGCAVEGFVELQDGGVTQLSMPYLGFYSGADIDESKTLTNAPVVEPFSFEKDENTIYPSDLVNDVTKQLVGKSSCEFGSLWVTGYAETTMDVSVDDVTSNDASLLSLKGFHEVGTNPINGKYLSDPKENIYVGNPESSNTMIVQQFVMRSCKDNFYEIKNENGKTVYKSALEDMLFGDKQLFKSHVDSNYLSAGYVAHRAYAVIPLYDVYTGKAFADGKYTITFNYQLSYDGSWVDKSYDFYIDSTAPEITDIKEYTSNGEQRVRIEVKDMKVCDAKVGFARTEFAYDQDKGVYYIDNTKQFFVDSMSELNNPSSGQRRLFVSFTDASYGTKSAIIHFFNNSFSNYVMAEGSQLTANMDFVKDGKTITWSEIEFGGAETSIEPKGYIVIRTSFVETDDKEMKNNVGVIVGSSVGGAVVVAGLGVGLILFLKKKKGVKEVK